MVNTPLTDAELARAIRRLLKLRTLEEIAKATNRPIEWLTRILQENPDARSADAVSSETQ
jgi:hypothetical protein